MSIQPAEFAESPTGRDLQREETRRRVREAALTVLRRDGLAAAKIDDIAKLAEVSRGTFYFHFPAKEDVLVDLLDGAEQRIAGAVAGLPPKASLKKALGVFSAQYAKEWGAEQKIFPDVGVVALRRAASRRHRADAIHTALVRFFRLAAERGEFAVKLPSEVLADMFLVSAFAAALAWCAHPKMSLETALKSMTDIFLKGVRAARR
jgi:AcrR family transcriptional regulator